MEASVGMMRVPVPSVPIPGHGGDPLRAGKRGQGTGAARRQAPAEGPAGICPCPSRRSREVVLVPWAGPGALGAGAGVLSLWLIRN